jgi:hypothetical protein
MRSIPPQFWPRRRLAMLFERLACWLAGQSLRNPAAHRIGNEVMLLTHPCHHTMLSLDAASQLSRRLAELADDDAGGVQARILPFPRVPTRTPQTTA